LSAREKGAPTRIRKWVERSKPVTGSDAFELRAETLGAPQVVMQWNPFPVDVGELVGEVIEYARDFADNTGRTTSFQLVHLRKNDAGELAELGTFPLRFHPQDEDGASAQEATVPGIIRYLLNAMHDKDRLTNTAIMGLLSTQQQVIGMLAKRLEQLEKSRHEEVDLHIDAQKALAEVRHIGAQQEETSKALEGLISIAGPILEHALPDLFGAGSSTTSAAAEAAGAAGPHAPT
jgi:hypothetical protein